MKEGQGGALVRMVTTQYNLIGRILTYYAGILGCISLSILQTL